MALLDWQVVLIVFSALVLFLSILAVLLYYCVLRPNGSDNKKNNKNKKGQQLRLRAADVNPEEPYFKTSDFQKMPVKIQKQLKLPDKAECLKDEPTKIKLGQVLKFKRGCGEYFEVGSDIESVVDEQGNPAPDSPRIGIIEGQTYVHMGVCGTTGGYEDDDDPPDKTTNSGQTGEDGGTYPRNGHDTSGDDVNGTVSGRGKTDGNGTANSLAAD